MASALSLSLSLSLPHRYFSSICICIHLLTASGSHRWLATDTPKRIQCADTHRYLPPLAFRYFSADANASARCELCVISVTQIQYQTCYYTERFCSVLRSLCAPISPINQIYIYIYISIYIRTYVPDLFKQILSLEIIRSSKWWSDCKREKKEIE